MVVEELMFKLQGEDSTATAPLFAEAAVIPLLERSPASFSSRYQWNKVITELLKYISLYFSPLVFIPAFFFSAFY